MTTTVSFVCRNVTMIQ